MFWIIIIAIMFIATGAALLAGSTAKQAHQRHTQAVARCMANHPAGRGRHDH